MSKNSKPPKLVDGSGGDISRRDFTNSAVALGATTALVTSVGGATGLLMPGAAKAATPKKGGHLRVGLAQGNTTDTLDPAIMSAEFPGMTGYTAMNQLVEVDDTGDIKPELAESWEPGDSPSTWIFNLRKGVTWHDGKSLDANDVIGTLNYHGGENSKSSIKTIAKVVKDMKADTKNRVVFNLHEPNAHFPFLMAAFQIRSIKDDTIYDFKNGTGSYVIKEWEPGIRGLFERNPNRWQEDRGHFDSAEIIPLIDAASRNNALVTGEVDVINRPDRKTWKRLGATKGVNVQKIPASLHRTWPMHTDTAPFDNNDVRLALKYGVDRDELVEKILNGTGSVGNDHPISPVNKYFNSELPQRVYDPDKAKFHLKKAGMENLNVKLSTSEGIWEGAMDAALLYSASAAKAGIKLDVNKVPNDGYWSDVWLKHPWSAAYWSGRPTEDWMFTVAYAAGANWNESRWAHPRFNELLKSARAELNEDRARDMYWEMQQLTRDEGGTVIALFADHLIGHSDKLAHGKIAGNWELDGYRLIERWWFA